MLSLAVAIPVTRAAGTARRVSGARLAVAALCAAAGHADHRRHLRCGGGAGGGSGYRPTSAGVFGSDWRPRIYLRAPHGILIAHVFFNLPLAIRLLLPAYAAQPPESWRLAAQLGMKGIDVFRFIEIPLLRRQLPGIAIVIFMLCFITFAVALTLGGGPAATSLEVAIYQALRFDFDLGLGAMLAILQVLLCAGGAWAVWRTGRYMAMGNATRLIIRRYDGNTTAARGIDAALILLGAAFVILPIAALVQKGIAGLPAAASPASLFKAGGISLVLGLGGGIAATGGGYLLAQARQRLLVRGQARIAMLISLVGRMGLFVSPMVVIGTGIFLPPRAMPTSINSRSPASSRSMR